jgi:hypothetical protein
VLCLGTSLKITPACNIPLRTLKNGEGLPRRAACTAAPPALCTAPFSPPWLLHSPLCSVTAGSLHVHHCLHCSSRLPGSGHHCLRCSSRLPGSGHLLRVEAPPEWWEGVQTPPVVFYKAWQAPLCPVRLIVNRSVDGMGLGGCCAGGKLVIVNLQQTPKDKKASLVIHAKVDQVTPAQAPEDATAAPPSSSLADLLLRPLSSHPLPAQPFHSHLRLLAATLCRTTTLVWLCCFLGGSYFSFFLCGSVASHVITASDGGRPRFTTLQAYGSTFSISATAEKAVVQCTGAHFEGCGTMSEVDRTAGFVQVMALLLHKLKLQVRPALRCACCSIHPCSALRCACCSIHPCSALRCACCSIHPCSALRCACCSIHPCAALRLLQHPPLLCAALSLLQHPPLCCAAPAAASTPAGLHGFRLRQMEQLTWCTCTHVQHAHQGWLCALHQHT